MTKITTYESEHVYKDGINIYRDNDFIYIGSFPIKVEDWPNFASWVLQTVAMLKVEKHEIEIERISMDDIVGQMTKSFAGKDFFENEDTFYRHLKKSRKS